MSDKVVTIGEEQHEIEIERDGASFRAAGQTIEIVAMRADELEARVGGRVHLIPYSIEGSTISFAWDGGIWFADVADKGARAKVRHRDHSMAAPMPGLVLKILVAPGDVVVKGAPLVILEAMKMEHQIVAPRDGTIESINCSEGELVQPGEDLVDLAEAPKPEA